MDSLDCRDIIARSIVNTGGRLVGVLDIIELVKKAGALEVIRRVVTCGSMRRLQERLLGHRWLTAANAASGSEIWVLGLCYKVSADTSNEALSAQAFEEFLLDFSSRIWITYRRGVFLSGFLNCWYPLKY